MSDSSSLFWILIRAWTRTFRDSEDAFSNTFNRTVPIPRASCLFPASPPPSRSLAPYTIQATNYPQLMHHHHTHQKLTNQYKLKQEIYLRAKPSSHTRWAIKKVSIITTTDLICDSLLDDARDACVPYISGNSA